MNSAEIREAFLDFFRSRGHHIVPSAPIVVKNDPTLLFTNAGMNQFKDYFLGNKKPEYKRVADTQKCLRVSGKHNDLEEVGVDTYHHTMFEMLGNWSFGDYFKKEAIEWSWELLTGVYKLDKDRLYVTVFEGDNKEGIEKDNEAYNEWKKWIPEERILPGSKKDNFWEMGDTGPCGPCSEIHYDCRDNSERQKIEGRSLVNNDHPQVIEIWNNVFIQFNRQKDGSLQPLPQKHVDTGMGFERLVRVLQQKHSNYDTDIFTGTIEAASKIVNKKYDPGTTPSSGMAWSESVAFRVIADHIRAIAFTIADGQLPSNTGAGYVIRRILRRAVRYYYSYLDFKKPLLNRLIPILAHQFENVFPELQKQADFVSKVVLEEEEAFLRTLEKGLKKIDEIISNTKSSESKNVDGFSAFELFDTYGFPIDLTRLILSEQGLGVDEKGFEKEMQQQKDRSRAATMLDTEDWVELGANGSSKFIGYDSLESQAQILRYRKVKSKGKESFQLVLDKTPFYAESGGQVGDKGKILLNEGTIDIYDTKKENELIIHFTEKIPSEISKTVTAVVDPEKRKATEIHHTATHLLHAALRKVLGNHVAQKGSLVNEEHLRFDFSHFAKMTEDEISKVEEIVNEKIRENIPVVIRYMPKDEAIAMGAMALFGEKYGNEVRVVIIDPKYSIELCGGTHVGATGELGFFKIKHETAVAAGVRRIEAIAGRESEKFVNEEIGDLAQIKNLLRNPKDLNKALESLLNENTELRKKLELVELRQLQELKEELLRRFTNTAGINFLGAKVEISSADALKKLCFELKQDHANYVIVLVAAIDGKAAVAIAVDETLSSKAALDAGKIIKQVVAPLIQGGGGGQKTLATGGGQDISKLDKVIEKVKEFVQNA
ncbi:MAG: alanine--tRNA ligase [Bacteroidetes bacterium]|nr:MAG: alanine--tRNA ligase [Bacteroidota bacterium]